MNKGDLINEVAKLVGTKKGGAGGGGVCFRFHHKDTEEEGTGSHSRVWHVQGGQKKGQDREKPANGAEIKIAAKSVPKFTAGKALKDAVA